MQSPGLHPDFLNQHQGSGLRVAVGGCLGVVSGSAGTQNIALEGCGIFSDLTTHGASNGVSSSLATCRDLCV